MKCCSNCGQELENDALFCSNCGESVKEDTKTYKRYKTKYDHTEDFDKGFVSKNKIIAASVYLFGFLGMIIALLSQGDSAYFRFHVRQSLKYQILLLFLLLLLYAVRGFSLIVFLVKIPIAALLLMQLYSFITTMSGRSVEPPIIRYFGWFK